MRQFLEEQYARYHRPELAQQDPVRFVRECHNVRERELMGLLAACLAYGRVETIMQRAREMRCRLGGCVHQFLMGATEEDIRSACRGFRHRFTGQRQVAALLLGMQRVVERFGSLEACFCAHLGSEDETIVPALCGFVAEMAGDEGGIPHFLPSPRRGSACKRLCLFLRWMVRRDQVDRGRWSGVSPRQLVVPLDVHLYRICREQGLTSRRQADLKAALEVTRSLRRICPDDPLRYDFALAHMGMRQVRAEGTGKR